MISIPTKKRLNVILLFIDKDHLVAMHFAAEHQGVVLRSQAAVQLEDMPERLSTDNLESSISNLLTQLDSQCREVALVYASDRIFSFALSVPDLPKEDVEGFIQLEAEQRLPYPINEVFLSKIESPVQKSDALVLALRRSKVTPIIQALKASNYQVISVTVDIAGILEPALSRKSGEGLLLRSAENLTLAIQHAGVIVGLRNFPINPGMDDLRNLVRDIRISIAQLPQNIQRDLQKLSSISLPNGGDTLGSTLSLTGIEACGLEYLGDTEGDSLMESIAEDILTRLKSPIEFLPPKPNRLEKLIQRFDSRKNFWITAGLGSLALITGSAFLLQSKQLSSLKSRWATMEPKVRELEKIQNQIREFRPWFATDVPTLVTMKAIFEAFPQSGEIWIKSLTLRNQNIVRCSGSAQYQSALLKVMDNLRGTPGIQGLELLQQQGNSPIFFLLEFSWTPGAAPIPDTTPQNPELSANNRDEN